MKAFKPVLSVLLVLCLIFPMMPAYAAEGSREPAEVRGVNSGIIIDDNAAGGYEGDYVVIYNPATSSSTSYSTGTMTGLIETTVNPSVKPVDFHRAEDGRPSCIIDVDGIINERNRAEDPNYGVIREGEPTRATSYRVGDTKSFTISSYNPGSGSSLTFKVVAVGTHCYIWTPSQNVTNYYTLDSIDAAYPQQAADEFDRMYDLMNSSFGSHSNGSNGDGKVSLLFYNIDDGWNGSGGFVAGYFSSASYSYDGMPIINIDTYPGVYYKTSSGNEGKSMDIAYSTACHEYQHCINYSNTSSMSTWLNECFSAAAEEICYPGSSVVSRIQSWENYFYSDNNDWDNPPREFAYTSALSLHKGYSMYTWSNSLEMDDTLALYAQVSFFAQYLYTRFGNSIYKQISNKYSSSEPTAITNATGVSCADLVRDFRVAVTANAAQSQYNGIYGFKAQEGYNPAEYHNVANPWSLLSPIVFTGTSCTIKGGGAITVKPVNGVYNPPSGASSGLKYIGIKLNNYTVTAVSNNDAWGTVSVSGSTINCTPADGYYVESCEVISGEATTSISGNTVSVSASSDCTIRVNFAPKPTYTVNFVVCGSAEGSQSALVNDEITLPASVSVNPEGWTFSGWTDAELAEETPDNPGYYEPGAAYTVTGNATLYALYTRVDAEGGTETVYELVTSAPSDWAGNYVITNNTTNLTTTGLYVLKGVAGSSGGTNIENTANCTAFADTGFTIADNVMRGVTDAYVVTLAPQGSYYSIQSASPAAYFGMNSSSYLCSYSSYNATYCRWTPAINASGVAQMKNAANGSYPYFGWSVSNYYFWSASTSNANVLRLWKEAQVTSSVTYYHTNPAAPIHEHTYGDVTYEWADDNSSVTATCTCTVCGDVVTETVNTTYDVVTEPTTEAPGTGRYTAVFENELFETQTRDVEIPQLEPTGYHIIVTDYTKGAAATSIEAETLYSGDVTFTVTCDLACAVAIDNGDGTYTRLTCTTADDEHSFSVTVTDADVNLVVVLKGDADLNGSVVQKDCTLTKKQVSGESVFTKNEALQILAADVDGNGRLAMKDATAISKAVADITPLAW